MRVVLATGIYPPDIGGPATYVRALAQRLTEQNIDVTVVTYRAAGFERRASSEKKGDDPWQVVRVSKGGGPFLRWMRYARALRRHGREADIVYAFSSVSCGVPLWMSRLRHPRRILRLGGDFLWERYTDGGGTLSLTDWYAAKPRFKGVMNGLLKHFDHLVFSTSFQEELYEKFFSALPLHSVIENALPHGMPAIHAVHAPMKLLFLGRFVPFKNLGSLVLALEGLPDMTLTFAGDGPVGELLKDLAAKRNVAGRVIFLPAQAGDSKQRLLMDHDLLVLPSYTELSPNTALEARAAGLPVLLTEETGLSRMLLDGVLIRPLRTPREIAQALKEAKETYPTLAVRAAAPLPPRTWDDVAQEHLTLFRSLL